MARTASALVLAASLFYGCGEDEPEQTYNGFFPSTGDQNSDAGGSADGFDPGDGFGSDGFDPADGFDPGDGLDPADGSDPGDGSDPADGSENGPGGDVPDLPEAPADCPSFMSGTQTIMGLETRIWAGSPSSGSGGPLVFYWHGTGQSPAEALGTIPASMRDEILAQGGMIVAPHDTGTREGQDVTFVLGVWFTTHDLGYADLIAACAVKNHNIDPRRIYSTGCSAGGLMTGTMALLRSSYVAAAAPNSGGVATPSVFRLEDPNHVPAVFLMHGGSSDNVITNFQTTSGYLADTLVPAGGFVVDCNHNMGHCRAPADLYQAAWQFMKDHPFGIAASPYAQTGLPSSFPSYCKIVEN